MCIVFFLIFNPAAFSQNIESKIDNLVNEKFKPDGPGAVFLVAKKGKVIYRKAFGMANLELNVKMKAEFIFGNVITIHHLLTHTSGIKDFTSMKTIKNIAREDLSPKELVDFFKNEPMDFKPGEQYKYCNSGYVLLGYIIEIVSGKTYADFITERIFSKTGIENTFYASHERIIKNRVSGYRDKQGYVNTNYINFSIPYATGAIMSNVDDMLKWQNALDANMLLSAASTEKAFTNYQLNNGAKIDYGYGWHVEKLKDKVVREHGGSIFGFKSMGVYEPAEQIYVVGLSNCECNSPTSITKEIASLLMD